VNENIVISCENLCHTYPNGFQALNNVSLNVYKGDYLALVGQNGSGKTTLAKHFNGLLKPTGGSVYVMGILTSEIRVSALACKVGYVFQNPDDMLFCSSVEEEIGFGMKMMGKPKEQIALRTEQIIVELGLEDLRGEHPFALSLGDRQRLAVACVLCLDPEIFVFDEPTTGQDFYGSESIMKLIDHLYEKGKTIVIITHDMSLVAEHAHRVVVMNSGEKSMEGSPAEVFENSGALSKLSLKPPQVALLAQRIGCPIGSGLNVPQIVNWLRSNYSNKSVEDRVED